MSKLKENLSKKMTDYGLSMRALSMKAAISESAVKKILNSDSSPRIDTVAKLAYALNCSIDDLVVGEKNPVNNSIDRELLERAVVEIDTILKEKNITLSSDKRAHAYFIWCELDRLDMNTANDDKFTTIMRLIR